MELKNKVVLITGGASGIGLGIVEELLQNHIKGVVIVDVNPNGNQVVGDLKTKYGSKRIVLVKTDVSNESELKSAFQKAVDVYENLDIVFNNAGIVDEYNIEACYKVNLIGAHYCIKLAMDEFLPKHKSTKEALLVNTLSIVALAPDQWITFPTYLATKCALLGLTQCLSQEYHFKRSGVKIMSICPGLTNTPILQTIKNIQYEDEYKRNIEGTKMQEVKDLTQHIVPIITESKNGSIWSLEDKKKKQVVMPKINYN